MHRLKREPGFTLVELLTVIFIIALLIAILIPSLTGARNAAKKTSTLATFNALKVGLETFKNDNEREFPATNGYPPSFAHPPIGTVFKQEDSVKGRFPFQPLSDDEKSSVYGAHWLPAMLMGVDALGYVKRGSVPTDKKNLPEAWYDKHPDGKPILNEQYRSPLYLDSSSVRVIPTEKLAPGYRPIADFFPAWGNEGTEPNNTTMRQLPVIVDAFGQAILYYAANRNGKPTNMIECKRNLNNDYGEQGPPYYFHEDNAGFTGQDEKQGWSFGGDNAHWITKCGNDAPNEVNATNIEGHNQYEMTFSRFIHDRNALAAIQKRTDKSPLKPVNPDTYLLMSPSIDGLYGTRDDVVNFATTVAE